MKIRDSYAQLNGDKTESEYRSNSIQIIASDGRTLFEIDLVDSQTIRVTGGQYCKSEGIVLCDTLTIKPIAVNVIHLMRPIYEGS